MNKRNALSLSDYFAIIALVLSVLAMMMIAGAYAASTNMDIDYSHNVIGTGTVMTDFMMGSDESTQAIGKIRGSGEVINKYVFFSNDSENISIEDQFLFSKATIAHEITLRDYPQMEIVPGSFRLLGTSWASKINLNDSERKD